MEKIKCPLMDKDVSGFSCGNASIDRQVEKSYFATLLKQAYGYQIKIKDQIVGYYMLYFRNINMKIVNDIMEEEYDSGMLDYYIAVHIRYLAIRKDLQHHGIGTNILKGIIRQVLLLSESYSIRMITLDALLEYYEWYKSIGFRDIPGAESDGITKPMFMDCVSIEDAGKLQDYVEGCF